MKERKVHYTTIPSSEDTTIRREFWYTNGIPKERQRRTLSYYLDISKLYRGGYKNTSFYAPQELYNEIDALSKELGVSKSSLMKAAFLLLLDSLGRLKKKPKVIYINLIDLDTAKKPLQSLLYQIGIKAKIKKIARSSKGSMLFIHLSDGRVIHLDIRERKGSVKKPTSYGLTTLEQFLIPDGFEVVIEE